MIRVFHIVARLDVGGSERVAINIASSEAEHTEYHIAEVLRGYSAYTEQVLSELRDKGISVHRAPLPVLFHWHYLCEKLLAFLFPLRFLLLWLRYRPDVVHCHTEMPDMAVWLAMRLFPFIKCRVVRTIHNTRLWTGMTGTGSKVERFMQRRHANIAISPNVARAYNDVYGELPPVIYNGVAPATQETYNEVKTDKTNICFAGRLEEQKGISTLCEIIKALADNERYYFHVFGSGTLQPLVDDLRQLPNVSVNPPLPNLSRYLSSFDYVIMPSVHEGLSILAIEASMNGVPLMINHCDGLTDTLPAGWPLAVNGNDMAAWLRLFREKLPVIDRERLVCEAMEYATSKFSLNRMQREYEAVYNTK